MVEKAGEGLREGAGRVGVQIDQSLTILDRQGTVKRDAIAQ
jgi:hypothetical protein